MQRSRPIAPKAFQWRDNTLLKGHRDVVIALSFSNDSSHLVSASNDQTIRVWDVRAGTLTKVLRGHLEPGRESDESVFFVPDGNGVVSAGGQMMLSGGGLVKTGEVLLWDIQSAKILRRIKALPPAALSPDGKKLAAVAGVAELRLFAIATGWSEERPFKLPHGQALIHRISWSPDGKTVAATYGADGKQWIHCWDAATGNTVLHKAAESLNAVEIGFSADSAMIGYAAGYIALWRIGDRGANLTPTLIDPGKDLSVCSFDLAKDQSLGAIGCSDGRVLLWNQRKMEVAKTLRDPGSEVGLVRMSPDGSIVAAGDSKGNIMLWNINSVAR